MFKQILFTFVLLWGTSTSLFAEKITHYTIDVTVEQSGELSIIETISYDFGQAQKHGMLRDIPFTIKHNGRIIDLGLSDFSVQMDDGSVTWKASKMHSSYAGNIIRLKIGSVSKYVTGMHIYRVGYRVKKGVLPAAQNANTDAIRWNIVGTGWQIPIDNVEAHFFLPEGLSQDNVNISTYTGAYGAKTSIATNQWLNPKELKVAVPSLAPHTGATVELAYPASMLTQRGTDNVKATFKEKFLSNWHWGALVGFLFYFWNMLKRYTGFEDKRAIAVQYEAPKGLSVLQSGLILDKFADNKDFSAAILELGYLGYLSIEQKDKKSDPILKRTDKIAQGLTMDQNYLLDSTLFKDSKIFMMSGGSESKARALLDRFSHINENLYKWSVSNAYMTENPKRVRKSFLWKSILWLLPVFGLLLYTLFSKYGQDAVFLVVFPLFFGSIGVSLIVGQKKWRSKLFGLLFGLGGMTPLLLLEQEGLSLKALLIGPLGVLIVLIIAMAIVYKKIGKFTQKGAYAQTELLGLKEYIKRVKQDEIKRRLKTEPDYLEKLLPYAVLFDEADHWLSFYDVLNVDTPHWYIGNVHNINHFLNTVNDASTLSSTSSSGGDGFSGGGSFSGGGGGGGGGDSW